VVLAGPIVNAVLHYGNFSARDASLTAETLAAFGVGLVFFSVYLYTLRSFYAMQDTRTPFLLNCLENGINIALALALYPSLGVQGLALAWSLAYAVSALVSLLWLRHRLGSLEGRRNTVAVARIAVASAVTTAVAWAIGTAIGDESAAEAIAACAVAITAAAAVYLVGLRMLGVPEVAMLRDALRRKPVTTAAGVPDPTSADA